MNNFIWIGLFSTVLLNLLIFIPINFKVKIKYDVLKNDGKIQVKLFKLSVFYYRLNVSHGYLELRSFRKRKTILVPIYLNPNSFFSQTDFIQLVIEKIKIQQGTLYLNFGAKTDAFSTSMVVGAARLLVSCFASVLLSKKKESKIKNKIYPSFNKDKFLVCFKASVRISIFKVLKAYIQAILGKIKLNKEIMQNE